jgi:putative serine/threonine protein kinase
MKHANLITIEQLHEEPYASIICYPRTSRAELRNRVKELQKLGVSALEFVGEKMVFGKPVLGKGCVGIVMLARVKGRKAALKIRRVDANRVKMQREAQLLKKANSVKVGPKLLDVNRNFMLMQFVDGNLLPDWLTKKPDKAKTKKITRDILEQCFHLDEIGLDHGELSHAPKHVLVSKKCRPFIVDFETASLNRRPSNVTSICQFLFLSTEVGTQIAELTGETDREVILEALRRYKLDRSRANFQNALLACGL